MKIRVLGAYGSEGQGQRASAFLVDDAVLVDAGTVSGALTVPEQTAIEWAVLSHAHLDHAVGLAYLADTLAMVAPDRRVTACSIGPAIDILRRHAFNDALWPDFTAIPTPERAVLGFRTLVEEEESRVGPLWVTPIAVSHTVPSVGYLIHDGATGFLYSGDTGPTHRLWDAARRMQHLRALIVETAFPNRHAALARASGHLTPDLLRREMDKMPPDLPIWLFHLKPQLYEETAEELARIDSPRIHILEQGKTYAL